MEGVALMELRILETVKAMGLDVETVRLLMSFDAMILYLNVLKKRPLHVARLLAPETV
jgi:hypothetical protein